MGLYGGSRDINMFKGVTKELLEDIIEQKCGYYKPQISENKVNLYGETTNKRWIGPVLIPCLIERGDFDWKTDDFGPDMDRSFKFKFFKDHLIDAHVVPEVGDALLWNEVYFEVNGVNENQLIVGKDNQYAYSSGANDVNISNFGSSFSIILSAHLTRVEKLGITIDRL
jgi:hypothetical protein